MNYDFGYLAKPMKPIILNASISSTDTTILWNSVDNGGLEITKLIINVSNADGSNKLISKKYNIKLVIS